MNESLLRVRGFVTVELFGPDGEVKHCETVENMVTRIGDQYYGERAAGIASPPAQVTGMQLGTGGAQAAAKTGTGAAIVTVVPNSLVGIDSTWPQSSLSGSSLQIQWKTTWPAGTATANSINEVVLVNQATGTQTAAPESATIARAVFGGSSKQAGDTLTVTWNHLLLGA